MEECPKSHSRDYDIIETTTTGIKKYRCRADPTHSSALVANYIILHELCHLKIKEHSHHFWELLHRYLASYQEKKDWCDMNRIAII
jgi:predicted metal-dependent hydrolase